MVKRVGGPPFLSSSEILIPATAVVDVIDELRHLVRVHGEIGQVLGALHLWCEWSIQGEGLELVPVEPLVPSMGFQVLRSTRQHGQSVCRLFLTNGFHDVNALR